MPRYEYRCTSCGEHLEVVQSIKDDPLTMCPTCTGALRKVFSPIGIAFKGSGFYRTDNRAASGKRDGSDGSSEKTADTTASRRDGDGSSDGSQAGSTSKASGEATST
jgi:putative FmdB family regulatory protein